MPLGEPIKRNLRKKTRRENYGVPRQSRYLNALVHVWGSDETALRAISKHLDIDQEKQIQQLICQLDKDDHALHSAVIDLTVTFPGLNLCPLKYVMVITNTYLLLTQCQGVCVHPATNLAIEESYRRDADFGISLETLLALAQKRVKDLTLDNLIYLLREANVFFWPLAKVNKDLFYMEKAGTSHEQSTTVQDGPVVSNKKKKVKKAVVKINPSMNSSRIRLVGMHTPTTVTRLKKEQKCKQGSQDVASEAQTADQNYQMISDRDEISIRKMTEKTVSIAEIHAKIAQCETKYTYYGIHDNIIDVEAIKQEDEPIIYDDTGQLTMSDRQQNILSRIVNTIGMNQNNWKYCCQIFFSVFPRFVPAGATKYDKEVLEVYLKMQYFGDLKKKLLTENFSTDELIIIRNLLRYFWGCSTVICNHFHQRSPESVCKAIEKFQKTAQYPDCFLVSLRILPQSFENADDKSVEHLQDEISALLTNSESNVYLVPCSHSSIVCPHRTFAKIPEVVYYCDFQKPEDEKFVAFIQSVAESYSLVRGSIIYKGVTLRGLIERREKNLFRLPSKTLIMLNGMKRLRDAGYKL